LPYASRPFTYVVSKVNSSWRGRSDSPLELPGSKLAKGVESQVEVLLATLQLDPTCKGTLVYDTLCFVDSDWGLFDFPFQVGSVWVLYPGALRKRLKKKARSHAKRWSAPQQRSGAVFQLRLPNRPPAASVAALVQVVSLNVNGIRAAVRRGLVGWVAEKRPDLICLQEIRATRSQLPLREFEQLGYGSIWNLGNRPGYSGVGILSQSRFEPAAAPLADPATEHEGRFLAVRVGKTVVTNSYVPNGNTGPERLAVKLTHLRALRDWAERQIAAAERLLLAGDFNIAAERIDVARPTHPTGFFAERTGSVRRIA